jgi:flagellar FliJ protein
MKKFNFRFTTLLKLREADRDQKRSELADAQRALEMIDQRVAELEQEMNAARKIIQDTASVGEVAVDVLLDNQRYELMLLAERKSVDPQRVQVAEETDRRRLALVESDRQVKTLEKLREKQQDRHRSEEEKLATKQLDEVAQHSYGLRIAQQ